SSLTTWRPPVSDDAARPAAPATPDAAAIAAAECEHVYASKHQPGHRVYWVRQCMLCHEVDWDDLDREVAAAWPRRDLVCLGCAQRPRECECVVPHLVERESYAAGREAGRAEGTAAERQRIWRGVEGHMDSCPHGCVDLGWLDDIVNRAALLD